jgi:hypothetical protein
MSTKSWMRIARRAALCAGALAAGGVALIAVVGGVAVASLRPQPGEWAVALPLGQTLRLSVGVPSLIRLATQPPVARWLADREWRGGGPPPPPAQAATACACIGTKPASA